MHLAENPNHMCTIFSNLLVLMKLVPYSATFLALPSRLVTTSNIRSLELKASAGNPNTIPTRLVQHLQETNATEVWRSLFCLLLCCNKNNALELDSTNTIFYLNYHFPGYSWECCFIRSHYLKEKGSSAQNPSSWILNA